MKIGWQTPGANFLEAARTAACRTQPDPFEAIGTLRRFPADRTIMEEGDEADYAYKICSGNVRLCKFLPDGRRQITGFLTSGALIGCLRRDVYSYSAETIDDVVLCCMRTTRLRRMLDETPDLQDAILAFWNDELVAAQEQMLLLGRKSARERLATFLLSRVGLVGHDRVGPVTINLPMKRADIADYLGLSAETVSREFSAFAASGMIEQVDKHHVRITDASAFRRIGCT